MKSLNNNLIQGYMIRAQSPTLHRTHNALAQSTTESFPRQAPASSSRVLCTSARSCVRAGNVKNVIPLRSTHSMIYQRAVTARLTFARPRATAHAPDDLERHVRLDWYARPF